MLFTNWDQEHIISNLIGNKEIQLLKSSRIKNFGFRKMVQHGYK